MAKKGTLEVKLHAVAFRQLRDWLRTLGLAACNVADEPDTDCLVALSVWERLNRKGELLDTEVTFTLQRHEAFALQRLAIGYIGDSNESVLRDLIAATNPYVNETAGRMRTYYMQHVEGFEKDFIEEYSYENNIKIANEVNLNLNRKVHEKASNSKRKHKSSETYSDIIKRIVKRQKQQNSQ